MKEPNFEKKISKPFAQSFWVVHRLICAGCYPGDLDPRQRDLKLQGLVDCGIQRVYCLMEVKEQSRGGVPFEPYEVRLQDFAAAAGTNVECVRFPIRDTTAPARSEMQKILDAIDDSVQREIPTYIHCWGGHGRTSTVVACYLIRHGAAPQAAIDQVVRFREGLPKSHYPFESDQNKFVRAWKEEGMFGAKKVATLSDWKTEPLPSNRITIPLNRSFPLQEIQRMRIGVVPEQMEDRWFIYWQNQALYFYRSWTGFCIYIVRFTAEGDSFRMIEADVSRDPEQYNETSEERDAKMISWIIDVVLLQKESAFPSDEASSER